MRRIYRNVILGFLVYLLLFVTGCSQRVEEKAPPAPVFVNDSRTTLPSTSKISPSWRSAIRKQRQSKQTLADKKISVSKDNNLPQTQKSNLKPAKRPPVEERSGETIMAIVASHKPSIQSCYKKYKKIDPDLTGSVEIVFEIDPKGMAFRNENVYRI